MHLWTFIIVFVISVTYGQDRKIISKLNPGCNNCGNDTTLVYIKGDGSHDTVHQIWDFTRGSPTVIFVIARTNSTMNITWNDKKPSSFSMSETLYSFAASIDKLYEYDDLQDIGHIILDSSKCPQRKLPMRHVSWSLQDTVLTDKEAMVRLHGLYNDFGVSGIIDIKMDLLPFEDYAVDLPHLVHTANSTLVDVALVNFTASRDYNASRYAIHFALVSTDSVLDTMNYTMRKSLDDEHTPGVFEIIEVKTPKSYKSNDGGYVQFRPVAYTEAERSVSSSTNAYISKLNRIFMPHPSTLQVFYHDYSKDNLLMEDMFISFGLPGDGYYIKHNFTSWSFSIGYGAPSVERVSLFVVIIICIGLGVPILLALSGITYVLVRRYKQRRNPPTRFTDDN